MFLEDQRKEKKGVSEENCVEIWEKHIGKLNYNDDETESEDF